MSPHSLLSTTSLNLPLSRLCVHINIVCCEVSRVKLFARVVRVRVPSCNNENSLEIFARYVRRLFFTLSDGGKC